MSLSPRIPIVAGTGLTVIGLIMGCFVARVSTFICIRSGADQQGICRLEQSTLFLPWNKTVTSVQLSDIQKAESINLGVDNYTVVLRLRSSESNFSLHRTEYSQNSQQLAKQINSFLGNSEAKGFSFREGGGLGEIIVLIGFCGYGLLFAWLGTKFCHRANSRLDLVEK
jgi:hypothetical protein